MLRNGAKTEYNKPVSIGDLETSKKTNRIMRKNFLTLTAGIIFSACIASCNSNQRPSTDILPVFDEDGNVGNFINVQTGDLITPEVNFVASSLFNNGVATVVLPFDGSLSNKNHATFVNIEGKPIAEGKSFISHSMMNNEVAWVVEPDRGIMMLKDNGKVDDRTFPEPDLLKAYPFFENKAIVLNRYRGWAVVNKSGDYLYHFKNFVASPCVVNNMVVECIEEGRDTKYGIVNIDGTEVTAPTWDFVGTSDYDKHFSNDVVDGFHSGRILVEKERKWGVINTKGEIVINPQFNSLHIDGDMYMFEKDDRWGWCSQDGQYIINPQFSEIGAFNDCELAPAKDKESREWGYVDKTGKWVINPQFDKAESFDNYGYAIAKLGNDYGLIDKNGKWAINPQFRDLISLEENNRYLAEISRDNYVIVDQTGKTVSKTEFKFFERILNPFYLFEFVAETNYINYLTVEDDLKKLTAKIKSTTSGELKKSLGEKAFSKDGGYIKIETINEDQYNISLKAYCNNAWSRVSDGWWSYKYVFNPNIKIDLFVVTVKFHEQNRINTLLEWMKWDSNNSTVDIDGKQYQVEPDYERFEVKFKCNSTSNNNNNATV